MTDKKDKKQDALIPPPMVTSDVSGTPTSVLPPPMFIDDDEPLVQDLTETAREWVSQHPWISHHSPVVQRVTDRGESEFYFPPRGFSGSPYQTFNGGVIVTGCLAAAQMAGTSHFGERASVLSANANFIAGASLDSPVRFRAEFVSALSKSRIKVEVAWYQIDTKGLRDEGSMTVILAKAKDVPVAPAAAIDPEMLVPDGGPATEQCQQLLNCNPYFSHMGICLNHVSKERGVVAHLPVHVRNSNTRNSIADGVLYAVGDALLCYAAMPWVGEAPTTAELSFSRIAQAPADAVLFGEASVYVELPGRRVNVHGQAYYLNENKERVVVGLYSAMIVGR